jgi:hypothetical protein
MVADRRGGRVWMIFFMLTPVRALCFPGDRERGEHDGQVGLDAVAIRWEIGRAARSDLAMRKDRSTW